MPHWHEFNPWADSVVYVPLERLAECVVNPGDTIGTPDGVVPYDVPFLIKHWHQCGRDKLDAYILPQPSGWHSLGVRFGAEGHEYYSPENSNREKTAALLAEFKRRRFAAHNLAYCWNCGGDLVGAYPFKCDRTERGEFFQACEKCGSVTYYDLE